MFAFFMSMPSHAYRVSSNLSWSLKAVTAVPPTQPTPMHITAVTPHPPLSYALIKTSDSDAHRVGRGLSPKSNVASPRRSANSRALLTSEELSEAVHISHCLNGVGRNVPAAWIDGHPDHPGLYIRSCIRRTCQAFACNSQAQHGVA